MVVTALVDHVIVAITRDLGPLLGLYGGRRDVEA